MAGAFQCMFIRGAIFTLTKKHGSNKAARNADLKTIFRHLEFKLDDTLNIQCTRLLDVMSRRWNGVKTRDEFVAQFSADKATRLDVASRSKHSLGVCQECERFSEWVESFPCKGKGMYTIYALKVCGAGGGEQSCHNIWSIVVVELVEEAQSTNGSTNLQGLADRLRLR